MRKNSSFTVYTELDQPKTESSQFSQAPWMYSSGVSKTFSCANIGSHIEPGKINTHRVRGLWDGGRDGRNDREEDGRDKSPRVRGFLRHTTYVAKRQSWLDSKNYHATDVNREDQTPSPTLPRTFMKKKASAFTHNVDNTASNIDHSNLKSYGNEAYDSLATKVKRTASFIEDLKRIQQLNRKNLPLDKNTDHLTSETERRSEILAVNSKKSLNEFRVDGDLGFKRRIYQSFYTPKPETPATPEIQSNLQKMKRGFTPNLKVVSPSHRRPLEKATIEDFIIENKLGGGKFGSVFRAYHNKTRSVFALKKVPKKTIKDNMFVDQFIRQVKLQSFMKHRNVLGMYGFFDDDEHFYMVIQFMQDGNLFNLLKKKSKFSEEETGQIVKQIAKGLHYMHSNGIAHRDLKPENIVISNGVYKICDFGWATICEDRRKTYCGTFDYTAPQIFEGGEYDMAVDVWGLGVIAYELLVGKPPFYHISRKQSMDHVLNVQQKRITFPNSISPCAISFIENLLRKNPDQRLSSSEILNHPFLLQVKDEEF